VHHTATSHHGPTNNKCRYYKQAPGIGSSNLISLHLKRHLMCTAITTSEHHPSGWATCTFMPPWVSAVCSFWVSLSLAHKRQKLTSIEYHPLMHSIKFRLHYYNSIFCFKLLWSFNHSAPWVLQLMWYILLYNGWGDSEEQLLVSIPKSEAFHHGTTNII
jgi:hypothetical protein